ncbi:hypothetical protein HOY80DRAFT_578353 [Tuber brumale]|nr:hypothetical protein HOY80DRAFT_578353 [Tuber brumale]
MIPILFFSVISFSFIISRHFSLGMKYYSERSPSVVNAPSRLFLEERTHKLYTFQSLLLMNCSSTRSLDLWYIVLNLWHLLYSFKAVLFSKSFLPKYYGILYRYPFPVRSTWDPVLEYAFFGFGDCRQRHPRRKNVCGTTCRSCQL